MSEDRQSVAAGRAALEEWERRQPANFYESDRHLQRVLERHWEADGLRARAAQLSKFGGEAATVVDRAVRRAHETPHLPRLERYAAAGVRTARRTAGRTRSRLTSISMRASLGRRDAWIVERAGAGELKYVP